MARLGYSGLTSGLGLRKLRLELLNARLGSVGQAKNMDVLVKAKITTMNLFLQMGCFRLQPLLHPGCHIEKKKEDSKSTLDRIVSF